MRQTNLSNYFSSSKLLSLTQVLLALMIVTTPSFAQQTTISLGSGSTTPGGSASVNLSLTTATGAQAAALQWTMTYPQNDIVSVAVAPSNASTAAGKNVTCNSSAGRTSCILFGTNTTALSSGVVATATFNVAAGTLDTLAPIQVTAPMASDPNGIGVALSAANGAITIAQPQPPALSSISCTPVTVNAPGSAACTVILGGAALLGGSNIALASNNSNITVPASVTVSQGQTSASFAATVGSITANQTAVVTASLNGSSATFTLNAAAPAQISSLTCTPSSIGSNATSTCTAGLNKAALVASTISLSTSNAVLAVPASVAIPVGQSATTFPATTATVTVAQSVSVTASLNGISQSASIGLTVPVQPGSLACSPATIIAPGAANCTISLTTAVPAGGVVLAVASNNSNVAVPATVAAAAGLTSVSFNANVGSIAADQTAVLTASLNGASQSFTLSASAPAQISSLTCAPSSIGSNGAVTCTVALNKAAFVSSVVSLSSNNAALTVPASLTIAAGQNAATFPATSGSVTTAQTATVSAALNGISQSASINLTVPVQPGSLTCSPATVIAPGTANCSVSLTAAVPAGGVSIALSSNNANITVPASVSAAAGVSSVSFAASVASITTDQTAALTASLNGVSQSFTLNASALARLSSLNCTPSSIRGNSSSTCTVALSKAGANVSSVTLSSSNPALVLPASAAIPAGQSSASFTATTGTVSTAQTVTVTATFAGASQSFAINLAVPVAPSALSATAASATQINLTWTAPADTVPVAQYLVERCSGASCTNFTQIGTPTLASYSDTGLTAGASYSYRVRVADAAGNLSAYSNTASATTQAAAATTITYVQGAYATPLAASKVNVTFPSAQAAGDLNVVFVGSAEVDATVKSLTDSKGNVYTLAVGPTTHNNTGSQSIYYAKNIAGSAAGNVVTVTFTAQVNYPDIRILQYHGADPVNPVDAVVANTGGGATANSGTLVTTNPTDMLVAGTVVQTSNTGAGAGFTSRILSAPDNDIVEDRMVTSAGSYRATAPLISAQWIMQMVAFRTAPAIPAGQTSLASPSASAGTAPKQEQAAAAQTGQTEALTLANIATGVAGNACSPGGLAAISGGSFGVQGIQKANSFPLPTQLGGIQVKVNGEAVPVLLVSDSQINFQCPTLAPGASLNVTVEDQNRVIAAPVVSTMEAAAPGLFSVNGTNQGVVLIGKTNEIAMPATKGIASRPAKAGDRLTIYTTGLGEAVNGVSLGEAAPQDRLVMIQNAVTVVVGGMEIQPDFAGLAPGTAGLFQINWQLPKNSPIAVDVPVFVKVTLADKTAVESNHVTIAIQ